MKKVGVRRLGGEKCKRREDGKWKWKWKWRKATWPVRPGPVRRSRIWCAPQVKRHVSYGGPIEAVPGLASFRELGPSLFGSGTSTGQAFSSLKLIGEQGVRARAELEAGRGDASIEVMHLMRSNRIPAEMVHFLPFCEMRRYFWFAIFEPAMQKLARWTQEWELTYKTLP